MEREPKFVILTCNWHAHASLEEATRQHLHLPPGARLLKVECLGQVSASVILQAFEKGADGVMLIGCTPDGCHYEFGSRHASELFAEVQKLTSLLGFREGQIAFHQVRAGEGEALMAKIHSFATNLASLSATKESLV